MTTHYLKQCRPDTEETEYFWKLFHAAQRNDARWHGSEIYFIAEELSRTDLDRKQKLFLLRAWQVLIDDKGGFGRFMGAFDTYVYNMQDPEDDCVAWKPELSKLLQDGSLLYVVLEAYQEARQRIADLENDEVHQRLANAGHQLYMADLAKHNLRASRKAQFRKRKEAEYRAESAEQALLLERQKEFVVKLPMPYDINVAGERIDWDKGDHYDRDEVLAALTAAGISLQKGDE